MTAGEAGEFAAGCGARRLVLTHISDELDAARAVAEAQRAYPGPVEVAREGAVYDGVTGAAAGGPVGTLGRHGP